jgi:hypothetical protein
MLRYIFVAIVLLGEAPILLPFLIGWAITGIVYAGAVGAHNLETRTDHSVKPHQMRRWRRAWRRRLPVGPPALGW